MAKTQTAHKQSTLTFPEVKRPDNHKHAGKQAGAKQAAAGAPPKTRQQEAKQQETKQQEAQEHVISSGTGTRQAKHKQLLLNLPLAPSQKQQEQAARTTRSTAKVTEPPQPATGRISRHLVDKDKSKTVQASSSPYKAAKRSNPTGKQAGGTVRYYDRYDVHGDDYQVGDAVYLVATSNPDELPDEDAEDLCVLCGRGHKCHTILECDRCLAGFHMGCLNPPLKAIPKGTWLCDDCTRGEAPGSKRKLRTTYEQFLFAPKDKPVLSLGLITGFVKNRCGDGEVEFMCRYFCRPEDTHLGRQSHHGSREVFLTNSEYYESVLGIFAKAAVCSAKDFEEEEGTDVFMCEYEYDEEWKRFRRRVYNPQRRAGKAADVDADDTDDSDFDAAAEAVDSDDEDCVKDRTFKPIYAFWAEKGLLPGGFKGRAAQPKRGGALNRQAPVITIADDEEAQEGGTAVLEMVGGGTSSVPAPATQNVLVAARKALATAAPPAQLPCRDVEKKHLTTFMQAAIAEEGGCGPGVLYVCGVPGTGKTACIKEVLAGLRPQALEHGVQLVFLNALSLPSPPHVYCKLWERLTGQRAGPSRALAALETMFAAESTSTAASCARAKRACMTLLVVDEIDVLITKDQSVLYNLFEWPMRPGARLAVIGISNTHDLDDRVLPRISSRLASSKLAFNAYSAKELQTIVEQRLNSSHCKPLVHEAAVQQAARKVASSSGDVRRALELLRRALEVADAERRKQGLHILRSADDPGAKACVTVQHVLAASKEMFSSPHMQFLHCCSRLEKLALVALLLELRATSKPDASVQAIHERLLSHVALLAPEARCEPVALCRALFDMAAKRLLVTSPTWQALKARVALNVHKDDVCQAIREDASLAAVHGQLA